MLGQAAEMRARLYPSSTVRSAKRLMGKTAQEVDYFPGTVREGDGGAAMIGLQDRVLAPEQVAGEILRYLLRDAPKEEGPVIVCVPAYFSDSARRATRDAAAIAGIREVRLLNEPTAAALAYGLGDGEEIAVVVDLGGGTLDVSVLEIGEGVFDVRATAGDNQLGGDDWDAAVFAWAREKFFQGQEFQPEEAATLMRSLRLAREELSQQRECQCILPAWSAGGDLVLPLKREEIDEVTAPLRQRIAFPIKEAMERAGISADDVDSLLLVGGMTRTPAIRDLVAATVGQEPRGDVDPDRAIALGAARHAASLRPEEAGPLLLDIVPLSLGIEIDGGIFQPLLPAGTTVPARESRIFTTAEKNQATVEIVVLQGERELAEHNRRIGIVRLVGIPPAPAGVPEIEVSFSLDPDGVLLVLARDTGSGKEIELRIEESTSLPEEEVKKFFQEANQYELADQAEARARRLYRDRDRLRQIFRDSGEVHPELEEIASATDLDHIEEVVEAVLQELAEAALPVTAISDSGL